MKKWVTILTAVLLCFTCLQVSALDVRAEDTVTIKVYNWGEYISDGSDDSMDVIKEFEAQYPGIKVSYTTY
ncbi:MAG: spermidine/putrescine ABC transporter substrate-binding protein, partial [Massilimaliae sp.]|nr:spermidine/putrescine ABC transporter substrate-binding protein [Massiliimalia sp.]